MRVAIVTTTIHVPVLLRGYCENAKKFGHEEVEFIVVGDKRTPVEVPGFCTELMDEFGYKVRYAGPKDQEEYLSSFPALRDHLPWNSISRRNVGILMAYRDGADVIVTIDDDNFALSDEDYVGHHAVAGQEIEMTEVQSSTGWYNVCEMLDETQGLPFYHRGFPLNQRWKKVEIETKQVAGKVVVNAGLWLEAPDIDALTWLDMPIEATKFNDLYPDGVALGPGTWSPFNSQNTALAREVIPAYFLSPHVGRYDDVWASYVVKRIADHLGDYVRFGHPLVKQERNPHDYFKDFDLERMGMEKTPEFLERLHGVELTGSDYATCFGEIVERLDEDLFGEGMRIWHSVHEGMRVPARA